MTPGWVDLREPPSRAVLGPPIVQALRAQGQTIRRAATPLAEADAGSSATNGEAFDSGPIQPVQPVQRAAADGSWIELETAAEDGAPVVNRAIDPGAAAGAEAGGAAGGPSAAGGGGQSERELDELARKLFPRIHLRLRDEFLIGRERIGALVDLGR